MADLDDKTLATIVEAAARAATAALRAANAPPSYEEAVARMKGAGVPPVEHRDCWVRSRTGAELLVRVQPGHGCLPPVDRLVRPGEDPYPDGRITSILDYRYPAGFDVPQTEDGLVPPGIAIRHPGGQYTEQYLAWRRSVFDRPDFLAHAGQAFDPLKAIT